MNQATDDEYGEDEITEAATYLEYLGMKSDLSAGERHVVLGAVHALKDHLTRAGKEKEKAKEFTDSGAGGNRRMSPKELLSEAERVLIRA